MLLKSFLSALAIVGSGLATVYASDIKSDLQGKGFDVVFPGDASYANASQAFNLRFTFKPAVVAYPLNPQQISDIIKIGAKYNHQVVARSGGHSYIANGLGGKDGVVIVDLGKFTKVDVDASSGHAVVQSGNRLGDIALALSAKGRGMSHGVCPYVGIGGHSAYGGFGFMGRMWGLTLDNILSIDLVLANGTITTASQQVNSDLFWAMRGSGGSFGITTSITFKTYPEPPFGTVIEYSWDLPIADAAAGLGTWQGYVQTNIPPQLGGELVLTKGSVKGNIGLSFRGAWYGAPDKLNATFAPFMRQFPTPLSGKLTTGNYIDTQNYLGRSGTLNTSLAPDAHDTFYAKSVMTPEKSPMSKAARTAFVSWLANEGFTTSVRWFVEVELYGGSNSAINAVALDATSFAHRSSLFTLQLYASSPTSLPPYPDEGFTFVEGMANSIINNSPQNWDYGAYPNYIDDRLNNWQELYYGSHYERLHTLKDKYDPQGIFSFPTAIED